MVCRGGPHNRRRDRRSGGGQKRPDTRGTCSGETEDDQQRLGGCATMNQKSAGLGLFFFLLSFGICKEACTLLTAGVVVADILCPTQAGAADGCTSRVFFGVRSGAAIILCRWGRWGRWGGMAPGARAGPPQSGNFYHRCTQYNLSPIHHPISKPTPPSPPPLPLITHHPPSTLHPPGAHLSCSSECTRCLGAAV